MLGRVSACVRPVVRPTVSSVRWMGCSSGGNSGKNSSDDSEERMKRSSVALGIESEHLGRGAGAGAFPLQATVPDYAPPIEGLNRVMQRAANIILNVTDRQITRVLNILPEYPLVSFLGNVKHIEIQGLITDVHEESPVADAAKYSNMVKIDSIGDMKKLPFPSSTFGLAVQCLSAQILPEENNIPMPGSMVTVCTPPLTNLLEMTRVVSRRGYIIIGMPSVTWLQHDMDVAVKQLESPEAEAQGTCVEWLMTQKLEIPLAELDSAVPTGETQFYIAHVSEYFTHNKTTSEAFRRGEESRTVGTGQSALEYTLAVLRRK